MQCGNRTKLIENVAKKNEVVHQIHVLISVIVFVLKYRLSFLLKNKICESSFTCNLFTLWKNVICVNS